MSTRVHRALKMIALGTTLLVAGVVAPASASASAAAAPTCGITWGSLAKAHETFSQAHLVATRTGRHDCWDRVVFELDGSADGYRVEYVDQVRTDGAGEVVPLAGGARLRVSLRAPAYGDSGQLTFPNRSDDHATRVAGYKTLRDVVYGGSFEGYTVFGLGVRARLPYRVFVLPGPGSHSRIVVDVAHRW